MNNILKTTFVILTITFFTSCDKTELEPEPGFTIEFGSECGWCAGQEFITVTSLEIIYTRNIPCGEEKGTSEQKRLISSEEWNKITTSFDYLLFQTLNYSECNVCADGCDEIIKIAENNKTHELRYSPNYSIIEIQDLQEILIDLLEEMREAS